VRDLRRNLPLKPDLKKEFFPPVKPNNPPLRANTIFYPIPNHPVKMKKLKNRIMKIGDPANRKKYPMLFSHLYDRIIRKIRKFLIMKMIYNGRRIKGGIRKFLIRKKID